MSTVLFQTVGAGKRGVEQRRVRAAPSRRLGDESSPRLHVTTTGVANLRLPIMAFPCSQPASVARFPSRQSQVPAGPAVWSDGDPVSRCRSGICAAAATRSARARPLASYRPQLAGRPGSRPRDRALVHHTRLGQHLAEELPGRSGIPRCREQKTDRLTEAVDRAIQLILEQFLFTRTCIQSLRGSFGIPTG